MSHFYVSSFAKWHDLGIWEEIDIAATALPLADGQALRRITTRTARAGDKDRVEVVKFLTKYKDCYDDTEFCGCAFALLDRKLHSESVVAGVSESSPFYAFEEWDYQDKTMTFEGGILYHDKSRKEIPRAHNFSVNLDLESSKKAIMAARCAAVIEVNYDKQLDFCFDILTAHKLNNFVPTTLTGVLGLVKDLKIEPVHSSGNRIAHQVYTRLRGLKPDQLSEFNERLNNFFFSSAFKSGPECFDWSLREEGKMKQLKAWKYNLPADPVEAYDLSVEAIMNFISKSRSYRLTDAKGMSGVTSGYIDGMIMSDGYADVLDTISTLRHIIKNRSHQYVLENFNSLQLHYIASNFQGYDLIFITKATLPPLCKIECLPSVIRLNKKDDKYRVFIDYKCTFYQMKKGGDFKEHCRTNLYDIKQLAERMAYSGFKEVYYRLNGLQLRLKNYRVMRQPHNGMIMYHYDMSDMILESCKAVIPISPVTGGLGVAIVEKTDPMATTTTVTISANVLDEVSDAKLKDEVEAIVDDDESSSDTEEDEEIDPVDLQYVKQSDYNDAGLTYHQFLNVVFMANYMRNMQLWSPLIVGQVLKLYGYKFENVTIIPRVKPERPRGSNFYDVVADKIDLSTYMDVYKFDAVPEVKVYDAPPATSSSSTSNSKKVEKKDKRLEVLDRTMFDKGDEIY